MSNGTTQRNTRWVQALDRILQVINLDEDHPIRILTIEDGREVVVVQPNAFTVSRIYATGRPDGVRPHGLDSYYDYYFSKLEKYEEENGSRDGFELTEEEWDTLFEESFHRYTRYLLFAGIKRWQDVRGDTDINLSVTNLAREFAPSEIAWRSYQYKGYMIMMNSIAKAELSLQEDDPNTALQHIDMGIQQIGVFCGECLREDHGDAENITRERYLNNLIEFRSDLEAVGSNDSENNENEEISEEENDRDLLSELEELLNDVESPNINRE
ncbi:MAG: DNA helicase UvrBC [Candidatus Poribacteria bacterium]|nr:DNA helicase UvrBC [Candidatus Poribacteria bacterium]